MNVVVVIEGREAIPVRAIPLLTDWHFLSPDVVAQVLAGDEESGLFVSGRLQAHRLESGRAAPVPERWWRSWSVRELEALSESISATELSHNAGYQRWRAESLSKLPPGAFVWKADFEKFHARNWNARARPIQCLDLDEHEVESEEDADELIALKAAMRRALEALEEWRELDFSPFIQPDLHAVVMEGCEPGAPASSPSALAVVPAPVASVATSSNRATAGVESADDAPERETRRAAGVSEFSMTKAALIEAHEHQWPSIRRDIQGASTNGLAGAKAGARDWKEAVALEWARAKGKLKSPKAINPLTLAINGTSNLPARQHKIRG